MVPIDVPGEIREALAPHHRAFQAAVAVLAARRLGVGPGVPEGIGKWEGGVRVNGREIVVFADKAEDNWRRYDPAPKPEEEAVAWAVGEAAARFARDGAAALAEFGEVRRPDPLRSFFGLPTSVR